MSPPYSPIERKAYGKTYRRRNASKIQRNARLYYVKNAEKLRAYGRLWRSKNRAKFDPVKDVARNKLRAAVRYGKVKKPKKCDKCGNRSIIHGHHFDYSKPLEVIWVCSPCHTKLHFDLPRIWPS